MATIPAELKLSKNAYKPKTKHRSVNSSSVDEILESVKDGRGFYLWPDLVEQLELHFELTKIEAAVEIRALINQGRLFLVPCWMTGVVALTKDSSVLASKVMASDEDEKQIKEYNAQYLKELYHNTERQHQKRRKAQQQRLFDKHREELLRRK